MVFVGAPGYSVPGYPEQGAVYLTDATLTQDINFASPHLTLDQEVYTRFGFAMEVLDINHDGIDDLVVSAPAYGKSSVTQIIDYYAKEYNGRIFVYLGKKDAGIPKGSKADFIIRSRDQSDVLMNLGQRLRIGKCNDDKYADLIILSPLSQQGGD